MNEQVGPVPPTTPPTYDSLEDVLSDMEEQDADYQWLSEFIEMFVDLYGKVRAVAAILGIVLAGAGALAWLIFSDNPNKSKWGKRAVIGGIILTILFGANKIIAVFRLFG